MTLGSDSYLPKTPNNDPGHFQGILPYLELEANIPLDVVPPTERLDLEFTPRVIAEPLPPLKIDDLAQLSDLDMLSGPSLGPTAVDIGSSMSDAALAHDPLWTEIFADFHGELSSPKPTHSSVSGSGSSPPVVTPLRPSSPRSLTSDTPPTPPPPKPSPSLRSSKLNCPRGPRRPRRILPRPEPVAYHCLKCTSQHNSCKELARHERQCRRPFRCQVPDCKRQLCDKRALERHYASSHKEYAKAHGFRVLGAKCPVQGCGYTAVRADNVVRHVKGVHGIEVGIPNVVR